MTALAALLAAAAAWLVVSPPAVVARAARTHRRMLRMPWVMVVVAVLVCGMAVDGTAGALWSAIVATVGGTCAHLGVQTLRSRARERAEREVARATQVIAGQLRVGAVPGVALAQAAQDCPSLERPAATLAIGGAVAHALAVAGEEPGRSGLASLSRAWELSERTGAPIAALAAQVGEQLRRDDETRQVVQAELSGPRATARMLAGLPLVGLLMGRMSGGDPVGFLTGSIPGLCCLAAGVGLACAGVLWTEWMAHRALEV